MTDDVRDDLESWLNDFDLDEDPALQPDALNPDTANRLLRRLRALDRQRTVDVEVAKAEKARIDGWLTARADRYYTEAARLEATLEGYMRARNANDAKVKTLQLPNGTLKLRPMRNRVIVEDRAAFLKWALARIDTENAWGELEDPMTLAIAALEANPLVTVSVLPSVSGIAKETEEGPADVDADGVRKATPIIGTAEIVPGVSLQRLVADTFSVALGGPDDATPPTYGEETATHLDPRENR